MKFQINQQTLLSALNIANKAIGTNGVIPILSSFLLRSKGEVLTIIGNNLQVSVSTTVPINSKDEINVCVFGPRIIGIIKDLPNQGLTFEIVDGRLTIISDSGKYSMPVEKGDDFPMFKLVKSEPINLPANELTNLFEKVLFAAGDDDLRMQLKGVYLEIESGKLSCTATNTNVFSTISINTTVEDRKAVIIPTKTLKILEGLALKGELRVAICDNNIAISSSDGIEIISSLIDEKYPDYRAVLPKNNDKELIVNNQIFAGAIKRVSQFGIKATSQVTLTISQSELTISAQDIDFNEDAIEVLPCEYVGDPLVISLSANQLMQCFSRVPNTDVRMTFSAANRAALIYGVDEHLMLAMPYLIV